MKSDLWHKNFHWNGESFSSSEDIQAFVGKHYPELQKFIKEWFAVSGLLHVQTSGSTGNPKTIALQRDHMINSARATATYFQLPEGSSVLLCLPLGYIAGKMMLVRAMISGWHLEDIGASSNPKIPKNKRYDFSAMVPLQLFNCCDKLENIETLIVGGGQVSAVILDRIADLKTKIFATYGMTETVSHVALSPINKAAGRLETNMVFKALQGIRFSTDKRQCLKIEAPHICPDTVVTNDVVDLLSAQEFVWLARYDHVINSGGVKLFPELIERKLEKLIDVPFFIDAVEDAQLGQKMLLFLEQENENSILEDLKNYQQAHPEALEKFEVPKQVLFLKKFIRTATGKINRNKTRRLPG